MRQLSLVRLGDVLRSLLWSLGWGGCEVPFLSPRRRYHPRTHGYSRLGFVTQQKGGKEKTGLIFGRGFKHVLVP